MRFITLAIAAAAAVSASPVEPRAKSIAIPVKQVNNVKSPKQLKELVQRGQERLAHINEAADKGASPGVSSGSITNEDVTYVAPVTIGGHTWQLIVDTGSSNLWCGARSTCEQTSTGKYTGGTFEVTYGSGSVSGYEYTDQVSFAGLTVNSQSLGSATRSSGFSGVDGIIGFGPVDLTQGTVSNANTVPTFMDNLKSQGTISTEVLGVYFHPENGSDDDDTNGELTLGGVDTSKYSGPLTYFPKLTSGTASAYWGISITSFTYGSSTLGGATSGIVDTGTTLIYIPQSDYNNFLSATGGTTDSASGLASFKTAPTGTFSVKFSGTTYTLSPSQYLIPQAQYGDFGLASGKYYSWINNGGTGSVNCIIGQKFLENYYSVFDTTNSRIGFATRT